MSTNRRMKRSRVEAFCVRQRLSVKDNEGGTYETYGTARQVSGEVWPASGREQALTYGEKLGYVVNVRIRDRYTKTVDEKGHVQYVLNDGFAIAENDGLCINVPGGVEPDYRIIAIKPYKPLYLEAEKIL